ncbi:MAG: hypothetical protein K2X98_02515, partial [Alphaproteobacteria bacterium]|nr:hypothetical protein [Alphaproteobacteria bacterium]
MKKKLKNIPKECVSFFVHCVSPFLILGGLSLFLTSCDSSSHQGRGLSTLVDRIKSFLGMGEHHSEPTQILSETESVPPSPEQNPTLATQPPSTEPALTVTGPAAIPSSQSAVDEREKTPATKQSSLSLDERMKLYTTFEETVLAEEEEKIKATENDASARIDAIMK